MFQRQYSANTKGTLNLKKFDSQQFEIVSKISQGAFGTVYLAEHKNTKQQIAIKKFFVGSQNEKEKAKGEREISILKQFNNPNIIHFEGADWEEQICSIYMEFCPYDLQSFIQNSFYNLDHEEIKIAAFHTLQGLKEIHSKNIVHRDLKPSNLMISQNGVIKVGDFGSAEFLSKRDLNGKFSIEGFSKWYTAPEILFGSRSYGPEIDIWSFACIFGELLSGLPLFPGSGEIEQILLIGSMLGAANETNWPGIKQMPDYGKINFNDHPPKNLKEVFPQATEPEIQFLGNMLKYEGRKSASELLKMTYFNGCKDKLIKVGEWLKDKPQINPYFSYIDLVKNLKQ